MKAEYDFSKGKRGPILPVPRGKTRITIRLDDELLTWFRARVHAAGGGSYQTLINLALRDYVTRREERLEETLRRVLREELPRSGNPPSATRKPSARRPNTALARTAGAGRVRDTARTRARRSIGSRSSS
jgi:hypothetical protein